MSDVYRPPLDALDLVYCDADLIVANKPSGLLSVPGRGPEKADSLVSRLQARFDLVLTIHRLDMETSGLIVFARNAEVQSTLSKAFAAREVKKQYEARVWGDCCGEGGVIDLPLIADWPNRPRQKVDHTIGKPSETAWRVLTRGTRETRIELIPKTGRSHQLRVHMMAIGHPILGDSLYGPDESRSASPRLYLHACGLSFCHPATGNLLVLKSPAPF